MALCALSRAETVALHTAFPHADLHSNGCLPAPHVPSCLFPAAAAAAAAAAPLLLLPAPPRLLACAVRFASKLPKGATRCSPFSCPAEQLPFLLSAVQRRVHIDSQIADESEARASGDTVAAVGAEHASTLPIPLGADASAAPALCHADEQLVRSLMTQLHQWPDTMQQLWTAITARKLTAEQV